MKKVESWILFAALPVALSIGQLQLQKRVPQKATLIRPDLVVTGIDFHKFKLETDTFGKTYWIFDVTATVKNQGNGNAGAFRVKIERNNGPGGAWQTPGAYSAWALEISGLAAGAEVTTVSRQYNNHNNEPSKFRFTADFSMDVTESDENNNRREAEFISAEMVQSPNGKLAPLLLDRAVSGDQ